MLGTAAVAPAGGVLRCPAPYRRASISRKCSWGPTTAAKGRQQQLAPAAAGGTSDTSGTSSLGLIMECDGALIDAHVEGHRVAFNRAFSEIGHDCTNWTPAVFHDLLRMGDGSGEGLIATYYSIRGWPVMLASSERAAFLKKVHTLKVKILREMAAKGEVPLRPGVTQFVDDALADGAKVAVVAATASVPEDGLVSSAMFNLGPNRAFQMRVVTVGGSGMAAPGDYDGPLASGSSRSEDEDAPPALSFEQQVAAAQAKAKSQAAQEFARAYNLQKASGMGLNVDAKMIAAAERAGIITPQFMAALSAVMGTSASDTVLVAGGHTIMEAAKTAGMLTLGVPPSVTQRGGFSAADAIFDGYGAGGGLTWRKAKLILDKKNGRTAPA